MFLVTLSLIFPIIYEFVAVVVLRLLSLYCPRFHNSTDLMILPSSRYYKTQRLTPKSDVFSFGVFLLELISGREAICPNRPRQEWSLVEWVRSSFLPL